jgi:hypothetical protein
VVDAIRDGLRGIATITVYQQDDEHFGTDQERSTVVTLAGPQYFSLLAVHPAFGRFFSADEERIGLAPPVAVVSDAFWRRRFDGSPADAIGQKIVLNKRQLTVIGVAPRDFVGADLDATDIWVPLGMLAELSPMGSLNGTAWYQVRWLYGFQVLARPSLTGAARLEAVATVAARRGFGDAHGASRCRSWPW